MAGFKVQSGVLDINTEDVACACFKMKTGALVTLHVDYIQRKAQRRYHISGTLGTIKWDVSNDTVEVLTINQGSSEIIEPLFNDLNKMYVDQMTHVLEGVAGICSPLTPITTARDVLSLQINLAQ